MGETLFVETGSHGRALGAIDLMLRDGAVDASRSRVRPLWSLEHVSAEPWCVGEDEVPDGVIDVGGWPLAPHAEAADYTRALGIWFGEGCTVVGCLDTAAWPGRGGSPLGSLVADALLHSVPGADIAVQNSGGLRGALPAGEVRRRDVAGAIPFDNKALLVELSGRDLIAGLQVGTSGAHGVLQPAGLTYTMTDAPVDRDADGDGVFEDWERAGLCGVLVDGAAVDPDETYRVVVPDFLHGGSDHQHLGLGAGTVVSEGPLVRDAIEAWVAADGACREVPQAQRVRLEACDPLR